VTAAALQAELRAQAIARFPGAEDTLKVFLGELGRVLADPERAADEGAVLLSRLEDYLEALLVKERWR
jgi:hypothetical protein